MNIRLAIRSCKKWLRAWLRRSDRIGPAGRIGNRSEQRAGEWIIPFGHSNRKKLVKPGWTGWLGQNASLRLDRLFLVQIKTVVFFSCSPSLLADLKRLSLTSHNPRPPLPPTSPRLKSMPTLPPCCRPVYRRRVLGTLSLYLLEVSSLLDLCFRTLISRPLLLSCRSHLDVRPGSPVACCWCWVSGHVLTRARPAD